MRSFVLAAGAAVASVSGAAQAYVTVHVETSSTVQAEIAAGAHVEDFSGAGDAMPFVSGFGGSGISGTFTGVELGSGSDGAFGVVNHSATLKLDRMVRYFGYRTAALDGGNTVELFSNGVRLGSFNFVDTPQKAGVVGMAMGSAIESMLGGGQDSLDGAANPAGFTFVNFISDIAFNEVRFTQSEGSFAFDDVSINRVDGIPEPTTWGMMILGFGAAGAALRHRRAKGVRFA